MLLRECHAWFHIGYVNTRSINRKLKSQPCLRNESSLFLLIKDKQTIISHLEKGKKGTNLALEFNISKQQISDICKNKETILKFTDSIEMSKGLEIHKYLRSAHKYSSRNQFTIEFVFFIPYTSLYIIPYIPLHYCLINIHFRLSRLSITRTVYSSPKESG